MLERISLAFHSWHLGHTCQCVVICLKICSFGGENKENMVCTAFCINTCVLSLVFFFFRFRACIFLLILIEFCFLLFFFFFPSLRTYFSAGSTVHCYDCRLPWLCHSVLKKRKWERANWLFVSEDLLNICRLYISGSQLCACESPGELLNHTDTQASP